jgi:hypothetical protein
MMYGFGGTDFSEVFQPKPVGETVNVHVVQAIREPVPDYVAMQRLITGTEENQAKSAPGQQRKNG